MKNRKNEMAHDKGFNMISYDYKTRSEAEEAFAADYAQMRVGLKKLDDAILNLGTYKSVNPKFADKEFILKQISSHEYEELRKISNYFYESNGIYHRLCEYLAFLYKCDWMLVPYLKDPDKNEPKLNNDFYKALNYLDNSEIKKLFNDVALAVIKDGAYYGYLIDFSDKFTLQQLPVDYCRSRYKRGVDPVIELNMKYFDDCFSDINYRMRVLKMFPKEIQQGYVKYKEGKLPVDFQGDTNGWYMLDPDFTIKFNLNGSDVPSLITAIPSILDLDQAQELDRKKTMQQLLKIVIQKLPLDKNGDLIFDVDEAKDIHNNAVAMLKRAVGVDVLTTFADIDVADMADSNSTAATADGLQKIERTVYNNAGISQNIFNTDGNLALEKSILSDEATMRDLKMQFQMLLNRIVKKFNRNAHYNFQINVLDTTIYNYKDISKLYKEQTQIGFSKMLPQIALGHSQSSILASAIFENQILKLSDIMIPPMMSSTMSSKNLGNSNQTTTQKTQNNIDQTNGENGRPEKADDEKSEKTIANRESMA